MNLTLEEISKAVGGKLEGAGNIKVSGYSIDSRTLHSGELFFAIKGPRFDGHQFVAHVFQKKASAAVVEHGALSGSAAGSSRSGPTIRVQSTIEALQTLARDVRRRWGNTIIGVTGSVGKTTTKEMIAAVLGKKFTVLRSVGNLNNEFGLPLCLLRIERYQNIAVLEMGMSAKGEIRKLASIAEPNEGVVTNVNPVHLEFFKSVDEIAEAKAELLEGLHNPKVAYLNNDDLRVRAMGQRFSGTVITYGVKSSAAFKVQQVKDLGLDGTEFTVHHAQADHQFVLPLLGQHNIANAVAAIAVGVAHEVSWDQLREALAELKPEKMRGQVVKFREGFAVIDDSYNSNPRALSEMIRFMAKLQGNRRKILVAGEMLELGPEGPELHRGCGREAARAGLEMIVAVQGQATEILEGALEAGMPRSRLKFVRDAVQAGEILARTAQKGDVILIKGSRGVKLEQALNTLRATFGSMEP
jgi:UDP-N-acetylmuramoyl-tripeptide--D-alanyl-D-alanine ligase